MYLRMASCWVGVGLEGYYRTQKKKNNKAESQRYVDTPTYRKFRMETLYG